MTPIHELLNRIRWDPEFGRAEFVLGYYDRVEHEIIRVPFRQLHFTPDQHFSVGIEDEAGEIHDVPLHRIKEVFRDGKLIWHREH